MVCIQPIDNYRAQGPSVRRGVRSQCRSATCCLASLWRDKNPTNYPAKYADGMEWLRPHQGGWQFGESGLLQALCDP